MTKNRDKIVNRDTPSWGGKQPQQLWFNSVKVPWSVVNAGRSTVSRQPEIMALRKKIVIVHIRALWDAKVLEPY